MSGSRAGLIGKISFMLPIHINPGGYCRWPDSNCATSFRFRST